MWNKDVRVSTGVSPLIYGKLEWVLPVLLAEDFFDPTRQFGGFKFGKLLQEFFLLLT